MSFEVRALQMEEREECIALWNAIWPTGGDAYFRKYLHGDIEWLPYYTQVGVLDGKLVSAAHICKRVVACGDVRLTMGGIANVATLPEFRGRGYNTECLRKAVAVMEADAMDFTVLCTGIHAYYERLGYEILPWPWMSGSRRPLSTAPRIQVRRAVAADVPRIREIYAHYNRERPIAVERSAAYWRDWIGVSEANDPPDTLVAADAAGRVVGYVRSGVFQSALPYSEDAVGRRIIEIGIDGGSESSETTRALLRAAMETGTGAEARLAIGAEPEVLEAAEELLTVRTWHEDRAMMIRLLHPDTLFRGLSPAWNERWIAAGRPAGSVTFQTPYGGVHLDAHGPYLKIVRTETFESALTQSAFFRLLFGLLAPDAASSDVTQIPLLRALFPARGAVYYSADGF